jgi:hypothetical protein
MAYTTMLVQYNSLKVNTFFEGTDPSRVQLFVVLDKINTYQGVNKYALVFSCDLMQCFGSRERLLLVHSSSNTRTTNNSIVSS